MSLTLNELYCDESQTQGGGSFFFGMLRCSPTQSEYLRTRLVEVRKQFGCIHEMKWTKVSTKMLPAYMAFVQPFFDEPYSQFFVREVIKEREWTSWGASEDVRFLKSFYVFLRMHMYTTYYKYTVCVDDKPGKKYRWSSLQFAVNNGILRDNELLRRKHYITIHAVDSKKDDLIQLVDILLGALVSKAEASAKLQLAQYVRQRIGSLSRSHKEKITIDSWKPTKG